MSTSIEQNNVSRNRTIEERPLPGMQDYESLQNPPEKVADINPSEGSKLEGIESGATQGADWENNVDNKPTDLAGINSSEGSKLSGIAEGADVTGDNQAASIAGQGDLATKNESEADVLNMANAPAEAGANVTETRTAAAISGQGDLATKDENQVNALNLQNAPAEAGANVTETRTAAAIASQGNLATQDGLNDGDPVGSTIGTAASDVEAGANKLYDVINGRNLGGTDSCLCSDGDYLYGKMPSSNQILRWKVEDGGKIILDSGTVSTLYWATTDNNMSDLICIGSYLYYAYLATVRRYTIADDTDTAMTISGTPGGVSLSGGMTTDGTYIYLLDNIDKTKLYKYSVSGTTMTYVSTITLPSMAGLSDRAEMGCDGASFYFNDYPGSGNQDYFKKTNLSGTLQKSSKTPAESYHGKVFLHNGIPHSCGVRQTNSDSYYFYIIKAINF